MRSFWIGLVVAVAVVAVLAVGSLLWTQWRISRDTITPLAVSNPAGLGGKALIVYQPGLTSFQEKVTAAFGEGLAAASWQVATTTASDRAPADVAEYDLVVLGSPVYGDGPGKPLGRYIERVADFGGKPVFVLVTAAGNVDAAIELTQQMVIKAKGRPIGSLGLTTMKPNDGAGEFEGSNSERAIQLARRSGRTLKLAGQ